MDGSDGLKSVDDDLRSSGDGFAGMDDARLARAVAQLYDSVEVDQRRLDDRKRLLAAAEKALADRWVASGTDSIRLTMDDGRTHTLFLKDSTYVSCPAAERESLIEWLEQNGGGALIKRDVAPATLRSHVKELIAGGGEVPPMVKTTFTREVAHRRA